MENVGITIPQLKNWIVVGSQVRLWVLVDTWPLVKTELHVINFAIEKVLHMNPFFYDFLEIFLEEERRRVKILVLYNIADDKLNWLYLIVPQSII